MFKVGYRDAVKGLIVSVLSSVITTLLSFIEKNGLVLSPEEWRTVATVAVTTFLGYMLKNFLTDREDKFIGKV